MRKNQIALVMTLCLLGIKPVQASQSQRAPICDITGYVISEERRIEELSGMSEGETFNYHDLNVKIISSNFNDPKDKNIFKNEALPFSCNMEPDSHHVFQSRKTSFDAGFFTSLLNINIPAYKGLCIHAKTNASGDGNFTYGNWIYDIEVLDNSKCKIQKQ